MWCAGKGETPFFELVRESSTGTGSRSTIAGISFRRNGRHHIGNIHTEDNIDTIPAAQPPARWKNTGSAKNPTHFFSHRGVPVQLQFLRQSLLYHIGGERLMSIENEVDQIDKMGIKAIDFEDDMLNLDITFFQNVLDIMQGRGIELSAMNGLYSQTLDIDTLTKMHKAGFSRLNFSLVDTSHAVNATQRRAYPANFLKIMDWLEASSFMVEAHFIIGLPGQAPADIIDTLIFLMGKRVLPGPSIYYPAPGSLLFDSLCGDPSTSFRYCRSSVMFEANPCFPVRRHSHS